VAVIILSTIIFMFVCFNLHVWFFPAQSIEEKRFDIAKRAAPMIYDKYVETGKEFPSNWKTMLGDECFEIADAVLEVEAHRNKVPLNPAKITLRV